MCPTGRVRDMCHVEPKNESEGGGDGAGSEGSLVTVTSAGGVHVWGVPAFEDAGTEGAGEEFMMPLLATHSLKVSGWGSRGMTPHRPVLLALLIACRNSHRNLNLLGDNIVDGFSTF